MQARNGHGSVQRTPRAGSAAYSHACAPKLGRRGLPLHIATRELHAAGSKSTIRSSQLRLARLSRGPRNRSAPSGAAHSLAKVVASTANHMRKSCNRQHLARHSGGCDLHALRLRASMRGQGDPSAAEGAARCSAAPPHSPVRELLEGPFGRMICIACAGPPVLRRQATYNN